jgi:hypothetical protein
MANGSPCRLKRTPGDPVCDFQASSPGEVTLEVKGIVGDVAIDPASTYSGGTITFISPTQIKFTVAPGHNTLTLAYDFTDKVKGAGTLNEVCSDNTVLDGVHAAIPVESYVVCV